MESGEVHGLQEFLTISDSFLCRGKAFAVTANTFSYNLCFIAVNTFLAVLFAVILSEARGKKFKKVTQSSIFLPYFVSWVIVGTIAYNLLNYENGVVNGVLKTLGWNRLTFMQTDRRGGC